jgi:hypothetical protein
MVVACWSSATSTPGWRAAFFWFALVGVGVGVGVEAVGDGATGLKLEPLAAAGPGLAAVIATPMTIGTTVISAATSARIAGHLRLRPPEGDGLVEVIFGPCSSAKSFPWRSPRRGLPVLHQR